MMITDTMVLLLGHVDIGSCDLHVAVRNSGILVGCRSYTRTVIMIC